MSRRMLITNGLWVTARYLILSLSGLALSLVFARLGNKQVFGQYQLVVSLLALFSLFSLPGLNMAAMKAIARGNSHGVLEAIRWSFKGSLLGVPFLLAYGFYLLATHQVLLGSTIVVSALIFPVFYAPNTWYVFYEGRSIFRPVAIRTVVATISVTAVLAAGVVFKLSVFWLVLIYLLGSSLFTIYFYLEAKRQIKMLPSPPKRDQLDIRYGIGVSAQKFVYTLSESLPPLAVGFLLGTSSVAIFQVANLFLGAVSGFIGALAALSLPTLFSLKGVSQRTVLAQTALTGLIGSIGYFLVVRLAFSYLYGSAYHQSYILALSLTLLPFIIALRTFLINYFTAVEKNSFIVGVYLTANAVALGIFLFLARRFPLPISAAAYLYLLSLAVVLPLSVEYLRRHRKGIGKVLTGLGGNPD